MEGIAIHFPELKGNQLGQTHLTDTQAREYVPIQKAYRNCWETVQSTLPEGTLREEAATNLQLSFNQCVRQITGKTEVLTRSAGT